MKKNKEKQKERKIFTAGILTVSDSSASGEKADESGKILDYMLRGRGFDIKYYIVIPDELDRIQEALVMLCDEIKVDLVITTGGVGFRKRDVTPEATQGVLDKEVPGISEALRYYQLQYNPKAMLSRGVAGIRRNTLIINLLEDVKDVSRSFQSIIDPIYEGLRTINELD
nr:MogA/MoaB family molybdenum cofactor biosynthesis protein [uncultured Cellulosilyticum sp.]